ncbi:zinc finger BED domain-containing protein RICESLEEPER 2-like [Cornus florida]|uniref:zinc finger BED domain-containing protein RICESLEEPER 2-like n=1 Tax=Cornus florida TaxID=4283 RepID=UPI00289F2858|nr:zinc finger BED domain-containing protein RICESLEEPER 2-like [Cornus florida]
MSVNSGVCFSCGLQGYRDKECPNRGAGTGSGRGSQQRPSQSATTQSDFRPPPPPQPAISSQGLLPAKRDTPTMSMQQLVGISVSLSRVMRDCSIVIAGRNFMFDLFLLEMTGFDVIHGMDWLASFHATIDCFRGRVTVCTPEGDCFFYVGDQSDSHTLSLYKIHRRGRGNYFLASLLAEEDGVAEGVYSAVQVVDIMSQLTQNMESVPSASATQPISFDAPIEINFELAPTPSLGVIGLATSHARKRKLTSKVWKDFENVILDGPNGGSFAICHHCKKKLVAEPSSGTSHLKQHLKRCVKRTNTDKRQKMIARSPNVDGSMQFGNFTFTQEVSRNELANAIVLHEYPLSIVEHIGFRRQKRGYMSITAHYVDEFWRLQNMIIGFVYVPSPHTSEILCDALMNCFLDWNLDRKISTITVDNCTTNDALIQGLSNKLSIRNKSLLLDGKIFYMCCVAHILNLIVKDGLDIIGGTIGKIRDSVHFWTASQAREEKFVEAASQLKNPCHKKLSLDCKTRWNSTYLILETTICYKDVFPRLKQRERLYTSLPSEEEWSLAQEICRRLELFYSITEIFFGTRFVTTNYLFPKICEVKLALRSWCNCENEVVKKMAASMIEKFDKYWSECHLVVGIAIVLDPRHKMTFLEHVLQRIHGDESFSQKDCVRQACYDLLQEYQHRSKEGTSLSEDLSGLAASLSSTSKEWDIYAEYDIIISDLSRIGNVKSELDHYLDELVLLRTMDFNILNWWVSNKSKYPTLQLMALDILAIPVSTVASESAFSISGRLVSPHRSRLSPGLIEALMCSQSWLWNDLEANASASTLSAGISRLTICDEEID